MGFRKASGTKPSHLSDPVPSPEELNPNEVVSNIRSTPQVTNAMTSVVPEVTPTPAPPTSPAPQASDLDEPLSLEGQVSGSGSDLDEPLQSIEQMPLAEEPTDKSFIDYKKFEGKDVEGTIMGMKVRQNKDGTIEIKPPLGGGKYVPVSESTKELFNHYYSFLQNMGAAGGQLGGTGAGLIAGAKTGLTTRNPAIALGLSAAGAAGGAYLGQKYGGDILGKYLKDPENEKTYYLLEKIAGKQEPLTPAEAAAYSGLGELTGGMIGAGARGLGKNARGAILEESNLLAQQEKSALSQAPEILDIQRAGERLGVAPTALEAASAQKTAIMPKTIESGIIKGEYGDVLQNKYVNEASEKLTSTQNKLDDIKNKFQDKYDFSKYKTDKNAEMPINVSEKKGYNENVNFISKEIEGQQQILNGFSNKVKNLTEGEGFNFNPTEVDELKSIVGKGLPNKEIQFNAKYFNDLTDQLKDSLDPDTTKQVVNQVKNLVESNEKGMSFDLIDSTLKNLQRIENESPQKNTLLNQVSGVLRKKRDSITEEALTKANDLSTLNSFQNARSKYFQQIGPLREAEETVGQAIKDGTIAQWAVNQSDETLNIMKGFVKPNQQIQFADIVLREGLNDNFGTGEKITANKIRKYLGNEKQINRLDTLIGEKQRKDLQAGVKLLELYESKNLTPLKKEEGATRVGKFLGKITSGAFVDDIIEYALGNKPDVKNLVKESIENNRNVFLSKNADTTVKGIRSKLKPTKEYFEGVRGSAKVSGRAIPAAGALGTFRSYEQSK